MDLSISNIAWESSLDEEIAKLLQRLDVKNIDIAPSRYLSDIQSVAETEIKKISDWWRARDIEITGMQSLLYGTTGLNLFSEQEIQKRMLTHLEKMCFIANRLGAKKLVFGSPKNRDCAGFSYDKSHDIACHFFHILGEIAKQHDVTICLEPNPSCYGANFMIDTASTAKVVRSVGHQCIKMQFDTGAIMVNEEDAHDILHQHANLIGHVHISEPQLTPIGEQPANKHQYIASAMQSKLKAQVLTIEMRPPKGAQPLKVIEQAIQTTQNHYLQKGGF